MAKSFIRISQFNVEGVTNKKPLLINYLLENDIDICLLNETWLRDTSNFKIPNYNYIGQNGSNGRCGVGILVKSVLKYSFVPTPFYEYLQTTAIILKTSIGNLSVVCTYAPPNAEGRYFRGRRLREIINDMPKPLLLSGDMNAHHVAFGCHSNDSRGNDVLNILDQNDLCILNTGSPTTVSRPNWNQSAIDITCVSPVLAPLCEWNVHDDAMGSYHYPTITDIYTSVEKYVVGEPTEKYLYEKADWTKYYTESENLFKDFCINNLDPLSSYNEFCDRLHDLKNICIPLLTRTACQTIRKPVPWWDNECKEAVSKSKKALNFYRLNPTLENFIEYKKIDAKKKKLLREKKKCGWRKLCESFNRYTPVSYIWNYIRRFKRIGTQPRVKNDEWLSSFFDKFAPRSPPEKDVNKDQLNCYFIQNGEPKAQFLNQPFTWQEFLHSIKSRKDTTPGLDNIPYKIIRNLHISAQEKLLNIFNLLWENQIIPASWKAQCVIPILKPNKPVDDCNSYRPISLSSCVGKLFEFMIKTRLDYYIEANNLLPSQQFGFRKGKSAVESFASLIADIKNSFHSHSSTVCAFLDVQGAFDNVNPSILIQILSEVGIPGKVCNWIFNFLYDRSMYVKFNNILHGPRPVYKGTMQGATISPLLYNIYTSQISKYLTMANIKHLQFADDLVLYTVNKDVNIGIHNLNVALTNLYNLYSTKLKLNINPNKSSAMIFCKKPFNCINPVLYNNVPLPWVEKHKFLGVWLDQKLKFDIHINYIIQNASKGLTIMRSLAGIQWGSDPQVLSMLYKSIVRSHFDYSILAYMNANLTYLKKLDVIQNKALRIISGAICSTPKIVMESETCILPLSFRRLQLAERFCVKLKASNNQDVINKILPRQALQLRMGPHVDVQQLLSGQIPEILRIAIHIYHLTPNMYITNVWPFYEISFHVLMSNVINIDKEKAYNQIELSTICENINYKLYTDGSKSINGVTSAYYDPQRKLTKCFKIDDNCTIFTAECYAIYQALDYLEGIQTSSVLILTDSQGVLAALNNNCLKSNLNYLIYFIKDKLYHLYMNNNVKVQFMWIKSHAGITGNEIVDRATRSGIHEDHSNVLKVPFSDYHTQLHQSLKELWKSYYEEITKNKGRWYADIQKSPPAQPWYSNSKDVDSRKFITTINRMRFGHNKLRKHLHKLKIIDNPDCTHCNEPEDLDHVIFKCREYGLQRLLLISYLEKLYKNNIPTTIQELLSNEKCYKYLYWYISNTVDKL